MNSKTLPLLEQLYFGKTKRRHIQEFGCVFGIIFCLIGIYSLLYGEGNTPIYMIIATVCLLALSYGFPLVVYPFWSAWMTFAHYLGIVMSFLFVSVTWVVMAIPLAFLLRIIGKEVMDLRYDPSLETYWEDREER